MNRPHSLSTRKLGLEQLEDKLPLAADVSFLDVGDSLALRIDTADQAVYFQATEDGYEFSLDSGQFIGTDNANVSGNGTNLLTVSSTGIAAFDSIEVDDFAAGGNFHFLNSGLNSVTERFEVRLDRMDAGEITFSGKTQFVGSASLNAETSKNILVNAGSDISTIHGDLQLSANQQETYRTDLGKGISIIDSTIEVLGDADLEIHGTGGLETSGGFLSSPIGVNIEDSNISGGTSGNMTWITGRGGNREADNCFGIYVYGTGESDPTAMITTLGSDVRLEGEGGGTGQSSNHKGILVDDGLVTATGLGEVTVIGQGGVSEIDQNVGVGVRSDFDVGGISSSGGNVIVEGTGGNGKGINVYQGGSISAKGNGTVTVSGTGGNYSGVDFDGVLIWGVSNSGQSSIITSEGGLVTVNGVGGGDATAGSGNHRGVNLQFGGQIVGPGDVVVNGTGGLGEKASNFGVFVNNESAGGVASALVSTGGTLEINGWGGGSNVSANNIGILLWQGGLIQGAANSPTFLEGNGGIASGDNNDGIRITGVSSTDQSSTITSAGGPITINGFAGGTGGSTYNSGTEVLNGAIIEGPENEALVVSGVGGTASGGHDQGVVVSGASEEGVGATITSRGGNVTIDGKGGGTGNVGYNRGVAVWNGGVVSAGETGDVTVTGVGGNDNGPFNLGVSVAAGVADARITSSGGDVLIRGTGQGGPGSSNNRGVEVLGGGVITAGGEGLVTVEGIGGQGTGGYDHGILVFGNTAEGRRSTITSNGGIVSISGEGGGTGSADFNTGVYVQNGGLIEAPSAELLQIEGYGGKAAGIRNYGVWVAGAANDQVAEISSRGGIVDINGVGGGNTSEESEHNWGVVVQYGGKLVGPEESPLSVSATGGEAGGVSNSGIWVGHSSTDGNFDATITSRGGDVFVMGQGGNGTKSLSKGVVIANQGIVSAGAMGDVTVTGTGGINSGGSNHGVFVSGELGDARITSGGGNVVVEGQGGGTALSGNNFGVWLWQGGVITSGATGSVTVEGNGGYSETLGDHGVLINNLSEDGRRSTITSGGGVLTVTGTGGTGVSSVGVGVEDGGLIRGPVDLDTTIVGQGGAIGNGVFVLREKDGAKSTIGSLGGDIRIEATGTGNQRSGLYMADNGQIQSGGNLAIVGFPSPDELYFGLFVDGNTGTAISASGEILIDASIGMWDLANGFSATTVSWGGGVWVARVNGSTPETEYDQLDIQGTVELGGIDLTGSYQPQVGESFILIDNDGTDAIVGRWFYDGGLVNEGGFIAFNGTMMQVSYLGGDGNDLEMTAVNLLPTLDSIDDLVLSEDAGLQVMDLTGISPGGAETQVLAISATSSNPDLIPTPLVDYSDPSSTGVLHFAPGRNLHGTSTITVILEDGGPDNDLSTKEGNGVLEMSFQVTVDSVNDAPTLTVQEEFEFKTSVTNKRVKLSNIGPGPNELEQPIAISFSTDSPEFLTDISLDYTNGSTGNLYFSTPPGELGRGYIYVTVEDGGLDNDLSTKADNASTTKEIDVAVTTTKRSYAVYDHTVFGEIEGTYRDTYWKNHSAQLLQETPFKGFKRSRLEHQWDFDLVGADSSLDFIVNASHDSSSEQFRFQYQLEGDSGWKTLVSTTQNESWQYHVRLEDPAFASDTRITVRVVDAARGTDDDSELATIAIERIFFQSRRLSEVSEGVQVLAFDPVGVEGSGDKGQFWFQLADHKRLEDDIEVFYEVSGTADSSDYDDVLSGSVIIRGGTLRTRLFITPNNDSEREGSESVVIRLLESEDYRLVGDEFASVKILDDDLVSHESFRESSKLGSHDLNYTQGWYENGDRELIIEEVAAGGKRTRMTHDWKFDLTGETQVMFRGLLEITSEADLDDFQLVYSTDRATWRSLGRITSEDGLKEITRTISLPEDVSDVWVRMFDRYRRDGDSTVSTVAVDLLRFERVISSGYRPPSYFFSGVSTPMYRSEPSSSESSHRSDNLFELLGTVDQEELEMDEGISLEAGSFEPTVPQQDKSDAGILEWLDDHMAMFP
ncbi:hypothetical protein N8550_02250 [Pirellulaceae bacterium]|nr:hypothetical protein [Pirellulaceae bacterium]